MSLVRMKAEVSLGTGPDELLAQLQIPLHMLFSAVLIEQRAQGLSQSLCTAQMDAITLQ